MAEYAAEPGSRKSPPKRSKAGRRINADLLFLLGLSPSIPSYQQRPNKCKKADLVSRLLWLPASSHRLLLFLNREPLTDQFVNKPCAKVWPIDHGEEFVGLLCLCNCDLPSCASLTHPNPHPAMNQITFKPSVGIMKCNTSQVMTESAQRRQSLVYRACS